MQNNFFVFGVDRGNANLFDAMIILILTIICFCSLGIISASFIMIFKRGDPVNWVFGSVSALLGGVL
jgi:ABC-2 type transport system permease protein